MTINKTEEGSTLTLALKGRLDTTTAPELEAVLKESWMGSGPGSGHGGTGIIFPLPGLRVILGAQKQMNRQGTMVVRCVMIR